MSWLVSAALLSEEAKDQGVSRVMHRQVLRLAYLCGARIPSRAANAVQTVKMCDGFAQHGHAVDLFARTGDADLGDVYGRYRVAHSFQHHAIPQRGPRGFHTALFLLDVRRGVRRLAAPDLYFGRDIYALALLAGDGPPLVYEAHRTMEPGSVEARVFSYVSRHANFCKLVTVTQPMMEEYTRQFPWLRPEQTLVLPNATDDMAAHDADGETGPWEGRPGALQVGYVGHLYEGRGVETLVEAARTLPEFDFHFVGGAPEDVARWQSAGVPGNAFFHGYVPYERVPAFYHRFDVLTAPYGERVYTAGGAETSAVMSPLKLYEYLSVGKPIVASDLPAVRTVLTDGQDALLAPPSDAAAFAEALRRLHADEALRTRLGTQARRRFEAQGTWKGRAGRLLDELQCVKGGRG